MPELVTTKKDYVDSELQTNYLSQGNSLDFEKHFEALFPTGSSTMERVNSQGIPTSFLLERGTSINSIGGNNNTNIGSNTGVFGHRQVSFDKSFDKDLLAYLDESSFNFGNGNGNNHNGNFYKQWDSQNNVVPMSQMSVPHHYSYQAPAEVLPLPETEGYGEMSLSKTKPVSIKKTKYSNNLKRVVPMPQKNVKYYGLCPHKVSRDTCKECQQMNKRTLSTQKGMRRTSSSASGDGKKRRAMQFWTEEEDVQLWKAIELYGTRKWMAIAKKVPGKDHKQCLQRWNKVLNPKLKKGRWKESEDSFLIQLVHEQTKDDPNKSIKWNQISEAMQESRSAKQCRERWVNHLNPEVTKRAWTEEEDRTLLVLHEKFPNKWANISRCLPGRSESMVKSRLTKLTKSKQTGVKRFAGKRTRKQTVAKKTEKVETNKSRKRKSATETRIQQR